jgi:hypothetical protein
MLNQTNESKRVGNHLNIIKWKGNDHGDLTYWDPMIENLSRIFSDWNKDTINFTVTLDVDSLVSDFTDKINDALYLSLNIKSKNAKYQKNIFWNSDLFKLKKEINQVYANWKQETDNVIKEQIEKDLKMKNKNYKLAVRKNTRKHLKSVVDNIEKLRNKDPENYWKNFMN